MKILRFKLNFLFYVYLILPAPPFLATNCER